MARITVEDCIERIDNRFELVLVAAKRAKQLTQQGAMPLVPLEEDKMPVVALREISEGLISKEILSDGYRVDLSKLVGDFQDIPAEILEETQQTVAVDDSQTDIDEQEDFSTSDQ